MGKCKVIVALAMLSLGTLSCSVETPADPDQQDQAQAEEGSLSSSGASPGSYKYTDWDACVGSGYCGTFYDTREDPAKAYRWVTIGTQTWMAENLAYLPSVGSKTDSSSTEARFYVYGYDGLNVEKAKATSEYATYGVLYNWPAARMSCPFGWHLPTDKEWTRLKEWVNYNTAGSMLKSSGGWTAASAQSNKDAYGFSALPGGTYDGSDFDYVRFLGYWWTTTESDSFEALYLHISYDSPGAGLYADSKYVGNSVRCIKNQ